MRKNSVRGFYKTQHNTEFTENEINTLIQHVTIGGIGQKGSTMDAIRNKIRNAYPEWEAMSARTILFRFVYKEGLVKL